MSRNIPAVLVGFPLVLQLTRGNTALVRMPSVTSANALRRAPQTSLIYQDRDELRSAADVYANLLEVPSIILADIRGEKVSKSTYGLDDTTWEYVYRYTVADNIIHEVTITSIEQPYSAIYLPNNYKTKNDSASLSFFSLSHEEIGDRLNLVRLRELGASIVASILLERFTLNLPDLPI